MEQHLDTDTYILYTFSLICPVIHFNEVRVELGQSVFGVEVGEVSLNRPRARDDHPELA